MRTERGRVARVVFPPQEVAQVKAVACELPKQHGLALSRFSRSEIHRFIVEQAVSEASASTIGRWIAEPFDWTFTRDDLADLFARLDDRERDSPVAIAA